MPLDHDAWETVPGPFYPSQVEKAAGKRFSEIGSTGLNINAGRVDEEFIPQLRGDRALKVYRQMADNDYTVGALLFAIEMLIRQTEWEVEPHEKDTSESAADFVEECFHDMETSWEDTLGSVIQPMLRDGWQYAEICYKKRQGYQSSLIKPSSNHSDGKIGWDKIATRANETRMRWEWDRDTDTLLGMYQLDPIAGRGEVFIPIQKAVNFRTRAEKNNPEGHSILRTAYRAWFYKTHIEQIESVGIERDLAGLPVAWVPWTMLSDTATDEEKAALSAIKDIVRSVKRNEQEGLVFPLAYDEKGNKQYDLTLLSTGSRRQFDTDKIIQRWDNAILSSVLADFIKLGQDKVGSFSLGVTKIDLFTAAIETWLDGIADQFNSHAIPRLLLINNMNPELAPKIVFSKIQKTDVEQLATMITALAQAGMPLFPDDDMENQIRDMLGLPPKPPEMDVDGDGVPDPQSGPQAGYNPGAVAPDPSHPKKEPDKGEVEGTKKVPAGTGKKPSKPSATAVKKSWAPWRRRP